jgi:hypothetical protein
MACPVPTFAKIFALVKVANCAGFLTGCGRVGKLQIFAVARPAVLLDLKEVARHTCLERGAEDVGSVVDPALRPRCQNWLTYEPTGFVYALDVPLASLTSAAQPSR